MNAPVAWRWNPYSNSPLAEAPPPLTSGTTQASPSAASSPPAPSSSAPLYAATSLPSGVPLYRFSASGTVIIPKDLAVEGKEYSERYAGKEGEEPNPRADVISLAQNVQDIDRQVENLANQPIDIAAAEQRVAAANDQMVKFLSEAPATFTAEQQGVLDPLRQTALNTKGDAQAPAQLEYFSALEKMLTPEQRANLRQLERKQEDATMDLQGQHIGQRIIDARNGKVPDASDPKNTLRGASSAELLSLAQAEGRALVAERQLTAIDRKVQDLYELVLTPENEAKLQPTREQLREAQQQQAKDPQNAELKQRVEDLTGQLENDIYALFSPNDREAVRGFEAHQRHLKGIASVLDQEAGFERDYYEMRATNAGSPDGTPPTALQKQEFQLSQHRFEYIGQARSLRGTALKLAASSDDEKLGNEFDQGMVDLMRKQSGLQVESRQFDHDLAVSKHDAWLKANPNASSTTETSAGEIQLVSNNATQAANGTTGVAPTLQAVNDSRVSLDEAREQHQKLEEQLKPKEVGFWDRVLEVAGGVLEIVGGVVVMAMAGWTGAGAVLGALMIADGALRTAHSATDWANGTQTDAPLSSLMQSWGMDRGLANGIDGGINFVATLAAGGSGALLMAIKGATMIRKGAGVLGLVSIGDNGQAVARSIITRENVQTFTVQWLQGAGLTHTQANYVNAFGGWAGTMGAAGIARAKAIPAKTHTNFVTFNANDLPVGSPVRAKKEADDKAKKDAAAAGAGTAGAVTGATTATATNANTAGAANANTSGATANANASNTTADASTAGAANASTADATANAGTAAATSEETGPTRAADFHVRGAPKKLREEIAVAMLAPDASPREIKKTALSLRGNPLVVLREVTSQGDNSIVGVAQVRTNAPGRLGRDDQGKRIEPHQAEIKPVHAADPEVRAQTIAAGTVGVKQFLPKQEGVFFQTLDPQDASYVAHQTSAAPPKGSKVEVKDRVRKEAPELLAAMPEADRPYGTSEAIGLTSGAASSPLSLRDQLIHLEEIPTGERHQWPVGSRDIRYQINFERPPSVLGSERLGKTLHVMHEDSYLAKLNDKANPVNWIMNRVRPKDPQVVHTFEGRRGGEDRVAVYFPAKSLPDEIRARVAEEVVKGNTMLGERVSVNRQQHPNAYFGHKLEALDTVLIFDSSSVKVTGKKIEISDPNQAPIWGAATIKPDFKGFSEKDAPAQYPWMHRRSYTGKTTYLGDVVGSTGGGAQVVVAAAYAARYFQNAKHLDFLTQRNDRAPDLYEQLGTQVAGPPTQKISVPPRGRKHPIGHTPASETLALPTQVYSTRFSNDAAKIIMDQPADILAPRVQQLVADAKGSVTALQAKLDAMDTAEAYSYLKDVPSTTVLIRYNVDFDVGKPNWVRGWLDDRVDKKRQTRDTTLEPQGLERTFKAVKEYATNANDRLNPWAHTGIENTPVRQTLRNLGYAAQYGFAQASTTSRGVMFNLAGMQLATGQVEIVVNDPRANSPFNFHPESCNVSVVFKLTGTVATVAVMGINARGPWPLDPNGLQPLGRGGPSLTDPTGPKSVGIMGTARGLVAEANVGVQWFNVKLTEDGPNITSVSSAGMKFAQLAANGRVDSDGMQAPASATLFAPSVINSFFIGEWGVTGRAPHVSLIGTAQTMAMGGSRSKGIQSGNHWLLGSSSTSTGATGYFLTRNPAYGKDLLTDPVVIFGK